MLSMEDDDGIVGSQVGLAARRGARLQRTVGQFRSVTEFLSDAVDGAGKLTILESIAEAVCMAGNGRRDRGRGATAAEGAERLTQCPAAAVLQAVPEQANVTRLAGVAASAAVG